MLLCRRLKGGSCYWECLWECCAYHGGRGEVKGEETNRALRCGAAVDAEVDVVFTVMVVSSSDDDSEGGDDTTRRRRGCEER